jgi:hypothetical protein
MMRPGQRPLVSAVLLRCWLPADIDGARAVLAQTAALAARSYGECRYDRAKARRRHLIRLNGVAIGACRWRPLHRRRPPNPHSAC